MIKLVYGILREIIENESQYRKIDKEKNWKKLS